MLRWRVMMLVCVLSGGYAAARADAQPTFGRPKETRPRESKPGEDPNRIESDPTMARVAEDWRDEDPERTAPSAEATPGIWYAWKTAESFRYGWSLPATYEKGQGYDLIVLLHPDGADFRWGIANHPRVERDTPPDRAFRVENLLVSVDGVTAGSRRPEQRKFECTPENAVKFRDVLLEFARTLPVRRMYLYGVGGGGRFAAYFSNMFPALADGVLDHGGGIADNAAVMSTVPIVFMHGAKDSMTPPARSVRAKDEYESAGHKGVRVRLLRGYNDFLNPVRASECLDYLQGMRADDADEAVDYAVRMLTAKPADEFDYRCPVWYAGAYEVLNRVVRGEGFENPPPESARARAAALIKRIDDEGAGHVARVRELMGPGDASSLALDGGPWLGYLVALRDDFRGVKPVSEFMAEIGLDAVVARQEAAAAELATAWADAISDRQKFETAMALLPGCFLVETLPVDLGARLRACYRKADELELSSESRDRFEYLSLLERGQRDGLEEYQQVWERWRVGDTE